MPVPKMTRRKLLLVSVEATPGTAEAAPSTALHVEGLEFTDSTQFLERPGTVGGGTIGSTGGARSGQVSFTVRATHTGSATAPGWATLLAACGVPASAGVYSPSSVPPGGSGRPASTLTLRYYEDGRLRTLAGCAGTFVARMQAGGHVEIAFTFTGKYQGHSTAALPTPTWPTGETVSRLGASAFAIAGTTYTLAEATLDAGAVVELVPDASDATGYLHAVVVDRRPTLEVQIVAPALGGSYAPSDWQQAGTTKALALAVGSGGGALQFAATLGQVVAAPTPDRAGVLVDALRFALLRSGSGDDDYTLSWSA